jgi:hypothetical protein
MPKQSHWTKWILVGMFAVTVGATANVSRAGERKFAPVPPSLEIEVIDPGVDPNGNPAVLLERCADGTMQVNIPPVVLVHRFYYSGDRSFQGPMLPGGPSIVVANHPKTGERCYIPAQMMPGAPRVTYTGHAIEYDYGEHAVCVHFSAWGPPTVKYRDGVPIGERVAKIVHAEQWQSHAQKVVGGAKHVVHTSHEMLHEAAIDAGATLETITLPAKNLLRVMPLGPAIFDPDRAVLRKEKIAEHQRNHAVEKAQREARLNEVSLPTLR